MKLLSYADAGGLPRVGALLADGTQVGAGLRRAIAEGLVTREQLWARSAPTRFHRLSRR